MREFNFKVTHRASRAVSDEAMLAALDRVADELYSRDNDLGAAVAAEGSDAVSVLFTVYATTPAEAGRAAAEVSTIVNGALSGPAGDDHAEYGLAELIAS